jgi:hypothetical protein
MKAVVVEIKNNKAAVLSDDGRVVAMKNNNYEIGQVILMKNSMLQITKRIAVFAASAAAFVILGTGAWAYATPYTYVSVDVNPSIEYTVNRFDRVLSVKAVNDDGEEILQEISLEDLENQTIEAAIRKTLVQITAAGYFAGTTEGGLVIATASKNEDKADELAVTLQEVTEEEILEANEEVIVESYSVGLARVEEAKKLGVTPGKLNLVEKLQASTADPTTINIEEWLTKPVKEIMKATKDNRNAPSVSDSDNSVKEEQKDQEKADKAKEREEQKLQKEEEKASDKAAKSEEKIKAKEEKAKEKIQNTQEKALKKDEDDREKDKKSNENSHDKEKNDKNKDKDKNNSEQSKSEKTIDGSDEDKIIDDSDRTDESQDDDSSKGKKEKNR